MCERVSGCEKIDVSVNDGNNNDIGVAQQMGKRFVKSLTEMLKVSNPGSTRSGGDNNWLWLESFSRRRPAKGTWRRSEA